MKGFHFIFGNFSNAVDLSIFCFDISIASATVFQTTFMCSSGKPSSIKVFLYSSTGTAKNQVEPSIALVSNCSG